MRQSQSTSTMRYGVPLSGLLLLASFAMVWFVSSEQRISLTTSDASEEGLVYTETEDSPVTNLARPPAVVPLPRNLSEDVVAFDDDQMYLEAHTQRDERVYNGELPGVFAHEASTKTPTDAGMSDNCVISGCSSQICADQEMMSACEWEDVFACYRNAQCERGMNGLCAWKETVQLSQCLDEMDAASLLR